MGWKPREWTLVGVLLLAMPWTVAKMTEVAFAQGSEIATTQVTDTIYRADGTAAGGTVIVSWPAFTTSSGQAVSSGNTSATLGAGGSLSLQLVPNAGSNPMGSYYTAVFHLDDGTVTREYWVVPVSASPVALSAIRSTVLPTSVAMQTVSKAYVDTAITAAVTGHPLDESSPYVQKTGDTMTGPLVLPGDPTAATQAADKHYVDTTATSLESGLAQKVSIFPAATQAVSQPTGTQLQVNNLNGSEYASQYVSGDGGNGIANATTSPDCANGCDVKVEHSYNSNELYDPEQWNSGSTGGTHVEDDRNGERSDRYLNPMNPIAAGIDAGQVIDVTSTRSAASEYQQNQAGDIFSQGLSIIHHGLTGGSNLFPENIDTAIPYFKSTYSALSVEGTYNTLGQHVLSPNLIKCYGVGDCLIGAQFVTSSGGFRDNADEGTHPFDLQIAEDTIVFHGTCSTGCTAGSTVVSVAAAASTAGTQGEGRYLIDTNPAKVISTGQITGGGTAAPGQVANFSGTSFGLSTFLSTTVAIQSQANNIAPGTVTVAIAGSGVTAGFATNTAALSSSSGVACIADQPNGFAAHNFEMANYTVVDGTHLRMTLNKPHAANATIAVGGLCGYGLEQTVDTAQGIRQVFPVIGSSSSSSLYYAGGLSGNVGLSGHSSAYLNVNLPVASIARSGGVVTVTTAGNMPADLNGLTLTVAGVSDGSYNGSFTVTTTGPNTLTYSSAGANSTSTGGTVSMLTGGFAMYPMAEVLGVFNTATKKVDGQMTLAPNTVAWAANDPVEEPHYYQEAVSADMEYVTQTTPRPLLDVHAGIQYQGNVGPGLYGFTIVNAAPAANYLGNGGTHSVPSAAYQSTGVWSRTLDAQAGDESVFSIHCNSHGCGKWNSAYNLFELDSNAGVDTVSFQPATSALTMNLRGTSYGFTPQGFTAGTINVGTLNATTLNGAVSAAQLPVMGASGSSHAAGIVPDPGPTAGTARYLREDGTWAAPASGGSGVTSAPAPQNMPQRTSLLAEYLLNEGSGTVADDTSGQGNNGTISGAMWEGKADLNFGSTGDFIQLPTALNATKTWQFAIYAPPFGTAAAPQAPGYNNPGYYGQNPSLLCGTDTQHLCLIASSYFSPKSMRFMAYTTDQTEAAEPLSAGWHIVSLLCGSNVGGVVTKTHILYDGAEVGSYVSQGDANTCPNPTTGNYQIGGSSILNGTWFVGKVAAAWAWSAPLSLNDGAAAARSALDYIRAKGVVTEFRKAVHATPLIVGGLDSRTYGLQLTPATTWLATLALTDPSYTTVNLGVVGAQVFDTCAMFDLTYGAEIGQTSGPTITVLWGGVNDLLLTGESMRVVANGLKCMVQKAKALGSKVVLATEISSQSPQGSTGDNGKNALDPILRAEAYGWGVDNIADLATDPHLGADGASGNAACFPDNLHPGPSCKPYVTAVMSDAINELIGSTESNRHTTAASTYQEVAGDRFLDLTGTASQAVSLPDCIGYSLNRQVANVGSAAATVAAINGETLTGSGTIATGARAVFVPVPGALATGGCRWERTQ